MTGRAAARRTLTVRAAVPAECGLIAALHARSFPEGWDEASFARFLADPACIALVADESGSLSGFIIARAGGEEADIVTLAVAPPARRKGIGRLLVEALADTLRKRGGRALFLEVGEGNEAAVNLYRRAGFVEAGRRRGYYAARGEKAAGDALVLRLDLA